MCFFMHYSDIFRMFLSFQTFSNVVLWINWEEFWTIAESLGSNFSLRIPFKNNGQPKKEPFKWERLWLEAFFKQPGIHILTTPGKNQHKYLERSIERVNTLKSIICCGILKIHLKFRMVMPALIVIDFKQNSLRKSPFAKCTVLSKFTLNLFITRTYDNDAVCVKWVRMLYLSQKV